LCPQFRCVPGPRSSASKTGRISTSVPPSNGACFSHSIASFVDLTCHSQKPAISSFDLAKGPSITVRWFREPYARTLRSGLQTFGGEHYAGLHQLFVVLTHLGEDFLAGKNARFRLLVAFTMTITLIVFFSLCVSRLNFALWREPAESMLCFDVERTGAGSTVRLFFRNQEKEAAGPRVDVAIGTRTGPVISYLPVRTRPPLQLFSPQVCRLPCR